MDNVSGKALAAGSTDAFKTQTASALSLSKTDNVSSRSDSQTDSKVSTETTPQNYVAYKAETNFVDVVPQAKRLRLSLNIDFSEINDPRALLGMLQILAAGGMATWRLV